MPTTSTPRLLFVHAHPDDETLTTGATIAHYVAHGATVQVVTCTLGEEGEVVGERWAQLAADRADQLGGYRIGELDAALRALGVSAPVFLGGAGRWRDSGMADAPSRAGRRFADADDAESVGALVAIIRELRPHVVVTYDPDGGYGHPDHIGAHRVTTAAVAAAAVGAAAGDEHAGRAWQVAKLYWTVPSATELAAGIEALQSVDLAPEWTLPTGEESLVTYPDERIDAVVDAGDALSAKIAAMAAHATQLSIGPTARAFALSNNLALPISGREHYVLAAGEPGARDARGWENDLLAGVDLSAV